MNNIIDYLDWRGDLPVSLVPFNEVDSGILSELIYTKFNGVVGDKPISIKKAYSLMSDKNADEKIKSNFLLLNDERTELFKKVSLTPRFSNMRLRYYRDVFNTEIPEQFGAVSIEIGDGSVFVAFRGTDNTIAGWKEDFSMILNAPAKVQLDSRDYLNYIGKKYSGNIIVGGHSKGGNLAMFSAINCDKEVRKRIISVYNFDGPLTADKTSANYKSMDKKITTYVPQSSIFGLLFEHQDKYVVVHSNELSGFSQHDIFSWEVDKNIFVKLSKAKPSGHIFDETAIELYNTLTPEQLETFIETMYEILNDNKITTFEDLLPNADKKLLPLITATKNLDPNVRKLVFNVIGELFETGAKNIKDIRNSISINRLLNRED